jgi:Arc/MetJ-type ribon-helix-helix transcriptional regulator
MATQIAARIPDLALDALDHAVRAGRFESRAAAVREGLDRLLGEEHEREIAASYRRAYLEHPEEEWVGEVGSVLAAARSRLRSALRVREAWSACQSAARRST